MILTGSGAQQASYSVDNLVSFPGSRANVAWTWSTNLYLVPRLWNRGAIPPNLYMPSWCLRGQYFHHIYLSTLLSNTYHLCIFWYQHVMLRNTGACINIRRCPRPAGCIIFVSSRSRSLDRMYDGTWVTWVHVVGSLVPLIRSTLQNGYCAMPIDYPSPPPYPCWMNV